MKRQLCALLAAVMVLALLLTGCGGEQQKAADQSTFVTLTDDLGRQVELKAKPARIVVTSASFLEPLEAVGGADLVVGRPDSKTKMPDYAKDIASVGKVYQIDTEKVLACQPDLVIINKGMNEKLVDALEANGIKTLVLDMKSYEDVKREVMTLAEVTGNPEKGQQLIHDMDDKIAAVKNSMPQGTRRVSIIHSTNQGLTVQLDGSIAGSVVRMLGWENVASAIKASMEETMQGPAWQSIPAVKNKQVYYLPQELFLLSPGIHYPEAVATMAKCVHPDMK